MAMIVTNRRVPSCCGACENDECDRWKRHDSLTQRAKDCPLRSADGLIEELEDYARSQGDGWDYTVVQGAIRIVKKYCKEDEK